MNPHEDIQRASRALGEAGLEAAGRGYLHEARRLLAESTWLSDEDPRYLKALGYCAFALGDVNAAYHAWRKAELLLGGRGSLPWVRSLEHGILRISIDRYNSAVTLAKQEKFREAITMLDRVHEEIPDFAPAGKAKGLALLGLGDRIGAQAAWDSQRELCRDDPDFDRYLTLVPVRVAPAVADFAAPDAAHAVPLTPTRGAFPMRIAAGAALAIIIAAIALWPRGREGRARSDSARAAASARAPASLASRELPTPLKSPASTTPGAPPAVAAPAPIVEAPLRPPPPSQRTNFASRYKQGAAAAHRGDWRRVISYLGPLGDLAANEPFHPHVLALLAQSYTATQRMADARRIAWKLVQKYPDSEYITAELREIAGVQSEHEK